MAVNTANLVSYWKGDKAGEFKDSKGTNHGTINGASFTADGKVAGAYSFDGDNDYISINKESNFEMQTFSISLWVKPQQSIGYLINYGRHHLSPYTGWLVSLNSDNKITLFTGKTTSPNYINLVSSFALTNNIYSHVVVTFTSGSQKIYINGIERGSSSVTGDIKYGTYTNLVIGKHAATNNYYFEGTLDEIGIWNTTLSASEVTELYNSGTGLTYNPDSDTFEEPNTLNNGLVSYWKFDGDATDEISGNDGTVSGATVTSSGKINSAYSFDGDNDYIQLSDIPTGNQGTINLWVYITQTSTIHRVFSLSDVHSNGNYWKLDINSGKIALQSSGSKTIRSSTNVPTNQWVMLTITSTGDGGTYAMYINGVAETSYSLETWDGEWFSDVLDLDGIDYAWFGRWKRSSSEGYLDGKIDEPAIWSRALTADEVAELYNSATGKTYHKGNNNFIDGDDLKVGLVSYWKLDDNASAVKDSVDTNDGTVTGATYTASGKINSAYSFDGDNDKIDTPNSFSSFGTINFWFRHTDTGTQYFMGTQDYSTSDVGWAILTSFGTGDETLRVISSGGGSLVYNLVGTSTINDGDWHMCSLTYDSSNNVLLYLDAVLEDSTTSSTSIRHVGDNMRIGNNPGTGTNYWYDGKIDEIGIWNRTLTSTEISELYNSGTGLQYPFSVVSPEGYANAVNSILSYTKINGISKLVIGKMNGV